ncbi:helix-turn-helix domain-containing protein [Qipengyuania sp.]|uniref:helix-turn-helix domain-containing protein n=1 Tax=Qipengyuania sp. TaxID=2004515 RepID=UPI003BAD591E
MQGPGLIAQQIKAARGALGWSVQDLADRTGVGTATLSRYELANAVPRSREGNLVRIRAAFEAEAIEFVGTPDDRPGIRIGKPPVP